MARLNIEQHLEKRDIFDDVGNRNDRTLSDKDRALFDALKQRDITAIRAAVQEGADVNADDGSNYYRRPIHYAAMTGNAEAVRVLAELGAEVNVQRTDPNKVPITDEGYSALHDAAEIGSAETVQALLDNGANIHARTVGAYTHEFNDKTPLHIAAQSGYVARLDRRPDRPPEDFIKIIDMLLERGADIEERTLDGYTPLHCSMTPEVTRHLLDKGANIEARVVGTKRHVNTNATPLFIAVDRSSRDARAREWYFVQQADGIIDVLLERGADVNPARADRTPQENLALLEMALITGASDHAVERLVNAGSDIRTVANIGDIGEYNFSRLKNFGIRCAGGMVFRKDDSGDTYVTQGDPGIPGKVFKDAERVLKTIAKQAGLDGGTIKVRDHSGTGHTLEIGKQLLENQKFMGQIRSEMDRPNSSLAQLTERLTRGHSKEAPAR